MFHPRVGRVVESGAAAVLLAVAGCGQGGERQRGGAINDPGVRPSSTPSASPVGPDVPLVGVASIDAIVARRALAVPIQVRVGGTAPAGLEAADLIFQEY